MSRPTSHEVLLTVEQVAERLNLSPKTVRNWLGRRSLASVRLGRLVRIPSSDVERLLEEGLRPALTETA